MTLDPAKPIVFGAKVKKTAVNGIRYEVGELEARIKINNGIKFAQLILGHRRSQRGSFPPSISLSGSFFYIPKHRPHSNSHLQNVIFDNVREILNVSIPGTTGLHVPGVPATEIKNTV